MKYIVPLKDKTYLNSAVSGFASTALHVLIGPVAYASVSKQQNAIIQIVLERFTVEDWKGSIYQMTVALSNSSSPGRNSTEKMLLAALWEMYIYCSPITYCKWPHKSLVHIPSLSPHGSFSWNSAPWRQAYQIVVVMETLLFDPSVHYNFLVCMFKFKPYLNLLCCITVRWWC